MCFPDPDAEYRKCCHTGGGRNLVLCIDGSSNQFGEMNTNVIELYNLILKGAENHQRTWYNSGIGTYARPSWKSFKFYWRVLFHKIDVAIAWDFERTVLAAYRWLSDNYEHGDCIFLFGFSRGAFQVRVLSAMIDKVGLIYKGNEMQIPFAFEIYADPKSEEQTTTRVGSLQTEQEGLTSRAERFKKAFSYKDVKVHFVGAWDTVSSIGLTRETEMLPRTVSGMQHVCYFRHALALDERRVKFLPEYAYGGSTKPPDPTANVITEHPHTLEVWFAGTHADIGGGRSAGGKEGMARSRPPLRWMAFEAGVLGLRMERLESAPRQKTPIRIKDSLTGFWWLLEILPIKRLTYRKWHSEDSESTESTRGVITAISTRKPHLGVARRIHDGQKIHSSLLLDGKLGNDYTPKARPFADDPNDPSFWDSARNNGLGQWVQLDVEEYVENLVERFVDEVDSDALLKSLHQVALSADGQQAVCECLYKGIVNALATENGDYSGIGKKLRLLDYATDILKKSSFELKLQYSAKLRSPVQELAAVFGSYSEQTTRQFLAQCTDPCIHTLHAHEDYVNSISFSQDGSHIVSGSDDGEIKIWDAQLGEQVGKSFQGHTGYVNSVAFSPDGANIASGSDDRTVRMWSMQTGLRMGEPLHGHIGYVRSVAFSPDGTRIVSGSADMTIRIWDVEKGELFKELDKGHTDWINAVAFSPDGEFIVSGSEDNTVRIWDATTGKQLGEPLRGHTDYVNSVSFSPDGRHIVSGSDDETIRIWDSSTGRQVAKPFQGHTDYVSSVAFSHDGARVVSGSDDRTVRIWNSVTGEQIGEPFLGHERFITSVAFSPDGRYVASASRDTTIRIWNADTVASD